MLRKLVYAAVVLPCLCTSIYADPIAGFTFPTLTATPPPGAGYNPTTVHSDVTVTGISAGSGLLVGAGGVIEVSNPPTSYPTQPVLRVSGGTGVTNLTQSINTSSYFEFTVTPDPGMILNLTSLTFDAARGGSTVPRGFAVFSSELGFAEGDQIFLEPGVGTARPTFTNYNIPLLGAQFQGIDAPTTFRFSVFMPGAGNSLEFDNILLSGSAVLLPEPASIAIWATIGAFGVIVFASRRRRLSINTVS